MKKTLEGLSKKILAIMLVFILIFTISCKEDDTNDDPFIKELNGVSETFKGAVSTETFSTSQEAAEAFVYDEIAGYNSVEIKETKSNKELSKKEIKKLNIPSEILEGYDTVEEIEITYLINDDELTNLSQSTKQIDEKLNKEKKVKVYVIKYGVDWKYFSPMPVTGDTINKSYYDSVFNNEKYQNCTLETTSSVDMTISTQGESYQIQSSITQLIKHSSDKVYLEQTIDATMNGENSKLAMYAYMETKDNALKCYVKMGDDGEWMEADLTTVGFTSLEELTPFYDQYLDYTYFTKTDYGFALADVNAKTYFMDTLMAALQEYISYNINQDDITLDMCVEYYVSGGVLSGMKENADVEIVISFMGVNTNLKEKVTSETKCTNYGTTQVDKPFTE